MFTLNEKIGIVYKTANRLPECIHENFSSPSPFSQAYSLPSNVTIIENCLKMCLIMLTTLASK